MKLFSADLSQKVLKPSLVGTAALALARCKVVLLPGQGGRIDRNTGTWCAEGDICEVRIDSADFKEDFAAAPGAVGIRPRGVECRYRRRFPLNR